MHIHKAVLIFAMYLPSCFASDCGKRLVLTPDEQRTGEIIDSALEAIVSWQIFPGLPPNVLFRLLYGLKDGAQVKSLYLNRILAETGYGLDSVKKFFSLAHTVGLIESVRGTSKREVGLTELGARHLADLLSFQSKRTGI